MIKNMHYDFKQKANKLDSQQNRNFLVPEIDWKLNEAYRLFVKMVAFPRVFSPLGFEKTQRNTDDIRPLVKTASVNASSGGTNIFTFTLPEDYWFYLTSTVKATKDNCQNAKLSVTIQQHDDNAEDSLFDSASFEWRHINGLFENAGIKTYSDGSFTPTSMEITYVKKPGYIHNAQDYRNGTYTLPNGVVLTNTYNCELPEHTHSEIVDIAVALASGEIRASDYQIALNKLNFNNLKN